MRTIHSVSQDQYQQCWDNSVSPVLTVRPGEPVTFQTREGSNGQIKPGDTAAVLNSLDFARVNPIVGPVGVEGARPGDVLEVDLLEIELSQSWGWTANIPGFGLLADEFTEPYLHLWEFDPERGAAQFQPGITIPLGPFLGVIGVAPGQAGQHSTVPPRRVGGNMDIQFMRAGTKLYLPVEVEAALFSLGDAHAAQGDGEVCGTAIETAARVTLSVALHRSFQLDYPALDVAGALEPGGQENGYDATTGIGPDLMEAARDAVRGMIAHLGRTHELQPLDAYALCSVAADLKISEIVDKPNWVVSCFLPHHIFSE